MRFCHLTFFQHPSGASRVIDDADLASLHTAIAAMAGLSRAYLYTPEQARDLYNDDGGSPVFGMQLYFDTIEGLEAAVAATGPLRPLAEPGALKSLEGLPVTQQAMVLRRFAVDDPVPHPASACSYVVHYPGPAQDFNAWINHYVDHHPAIMRRFPGIRELEILTRMDWRDGLPWTRVHHMQRNRIMFDSPAALTAALQSPVRHEMRSDFTTFPSYEGGNFHYPMATRLIAGR